LQYREFTLKIKMEGEFRYNTLSWCQFEFPVIGFHTSILPLALAQANRTEEIDFVAANAEDFGCDCNCDCDCDCNCDCDCDWGVDGGVNEDKTAGGTTTTEDGSLAENEMDGENARHVIADGTCSINRHRCIRSLFPALSP
jgi:hypothetical protein